MNERIWTAGLVIIGDEILSGRTQDANLANLAKWLNVQGIRLGEVRVVSDRTEHIVGAVNALRSAHDYVFTTGGIGPTHDDITVDAIAEAFGVPAVIHPRARSLLADYYAGRGGLNEGRLRMARVPEGGELIENEATGAPGIRIGNVYILAGVPPIALKMMDALTGKLEGGKPLLSHTIGCVVAESEVAGLLLQVERAHEGCQIGSYPFFRDGGVGANFVIRSTDPHRLSECAKALMEGLRAQGREPVDGGI